MALQIEDLVASIRKDGVEAAQRDADKIVSAAKAQAQQIVEQAKRDAAQLKADTERELSVRDASARATLAQAGRDVELSLKKALSAQLDRLLEARVEKALSASELASLIASVVKSGVVDTKKEEIQVNEKTCKALCQELAASLADELKGGLVVKPVRGVDTGFRIAEKDGSGFYDFSAEEIASLLKPFLGDEMAKIVFTA